MSNNQQKHEKATKFFHDHIGDKEISIWSVKKVHSGLTNETYCIKTNKGKYQVRFATAYEGIDREIEKQMLEQTTGYIYFDKNGNMIRRWLNGKALPHALLWRRINKVFYGLNLLHTKKIKTTKKIDYKEYLDKNPKHPKMNELYLELIKKFDSNSKVTISHNDVTNKNIIYNHGKTSLIDYEWSRLNYEWFDLIYFLIHSHLPRHTLVKLASNRQKEINAENFFFVSYFCLSWINTVKDNRMKFKLLKRKYERNTSHFYHEVMTMNKHNNKSKNK